MLVIVLVYKWGRQYKEMIEGIAQKKEAHGASMGVYACVCVSTCACKCDPKC